VGTECGKHPARSVERLAESRDIAMPEYRPDSGKQTTLLAIDERPLRDHGPHQRLCHREPQRHRFPLL
jgi:hypothetical protein